MLDSTAGQQVIAVSMSSHLTGVRLKRCGVRSPVIVRRAGKHFEIWLRSTDGTRRRVGQVGIDLATDARRFGQDLLADMMETALRQFEREEWFGMGHSASVGAPGVYLPKPRGRRAVI